MNEGIETFERAITVLVLMIISFAVGTFVGNEYSKKVHKTPPVEEIVKADSLIKVNDSIKIVVSNLDSIKDAKIIEVQALDNDSTRKLFYELINK